MKDRGSYPVRAILIGVSVMACAALDGRAQTDVQEMLRKRLEQGAGRLLIPAGTHVFSNTLEIDLVRHGAISIRADGPVTIRMAGSGPAIRVTGTHGGTADPRSFEGKTWLQRMPLIEGVEIVGAHPEADGIELSGTMQAIITRVAVRKARHGIRLVERNRNVVISDCHLYENSGVGIFLDAVNLHQINVANTHVSYNRGGGIVVRDGEVRNLHVSGCDIEANMPGDETPTETANILIDQASEEAMGSVAEVAITGCTIQHSAHYGRKKVAPGGANIRILGSDRHRPNMIAVTGNILSDTTTHLHLRKVMDVTVTGNTFFTTEPTDLLIEDCRRVTVTGNAFNPREEGAVGGIVLRDSAHCILSGLTIHRFGRGGGSVMMERCFASRMTSCILSDCQSGIRLVDCEGCVVSDCTLTGLPVGAKPVEASGKENTVRGILSLGRDVLDAGGSE